MRAIEFIIEGYPDAIAEFSREADPTEVRTVIDQYKQLVNKNQFRDPREKNIDHWRPKGWTAFSQMVKLKSSDITDSQRKRGKTVGNAIILQDDSKWTVVIPLDKEASVHYGKATEWCTTKPSQPYFENYFYRDEITLIYAIPKNKENDSHVAISIKPNGTIQMFNRADDPINAQQYTQISGLDSDKFIAMSRESVNQIKLDFTRDRYQEAIEDTKRLLYETPLDVDALERALKLTKKPDDCYRYICAYGQEQNKRVTVHPSILIATAMYVGNNTAILSARNVGQYIDFSAITSSTFKSILRSTPEIFIHNYKSLSSNQISMFATTPASAYQYAAIVLNRSEFPEGEAAIATSAEYSFKYANMLGKPFPEGEAAIATSAIDSFEYATDVLDNNPFPAGEPAIAKNAMLSFKYTKYVLSKIDKQPFPAGEPVIATDDFYAYAYANLLGRPFPAGEPAIAQVDDTSEAYVNHILKYHRSITWENLIKDDPKKSYDYAIARQQAFPAGEAAIATDAQYSYDYAVVVLKYKRFPAGEAAIATSDMHSYLYAYEVLNKHPFPAGEPAIAQSNYYTKQYIKNIISYHPSKTWEELMSQTPSLPLNINRNSVRDVFNYVSQTKHEIQEAESIIATSTEYSFKYAVNVTHKPFPEGEPAIAKNAKYSYLYAVMVLEGFRFPAGEKVIATSAEYSALYAINVIEDQFPPGEMAIATDPAYAELYDDAFGTNLAQR